jgi:trk system potassium uptake protein TrkA
MAKKKHFVVLGLGSFGSALARRLYQNGCRVTGVDADEAQVESLKDSLYEAVIANVTDRKALEELSLADVDAVFISLGENQNMTPSILAALHARELGARRIIVKGLSEEHGKILKMLGVERVVFPEAEIALAMADRVTWPNVLDYMPIDPDYSFVELAMPDSLVGRSLREADLRRLYNVWVMGVKDALNGRLELFPAPDYRFGADQMLVVVAKKDDLNRLRELK